MTRTAADTSPERVAETVEGLAFMSFGIAKEAGDLLSALAAERDRTEADLALIEQWLMNLAAERDALAERLYKALGDIPQYDADDYGVVLDHDTGRAALNETGDDTP